MMGYRTVSKDFGMALLLINKIHGLTRTLLHLQTSTKKLIRHFGSLPKFQMKPNHLIESELTELK